VAYQEFTATTSASGSLGTAQPLPAPWGQGKSTVSLSCPQAGYCALATGSPTGYLVNEATAATVTLKASSSALTYGSEQSETLTATATSPAGGTPTGTVTVTNGIAKPCVITLHGGTGSCTLSATALPGGFYKLTATYSGDASYVSATSTTTVTVAGAPVKVGFAFSPSTVTYTSHTLTFTFTISVTSAAGTPTGSADGIIGPYNAVPGICPANLTAGKATCTVSYPLAGGRYPVVVTYGGSTNFLAGTSGTQYLTVARAKTTTSLSLSKATITYGHENAEKLTVSVSHLSGSYSTGKVTIKAGSTVLCIISLSKSTGSCILSTKKLKAGTYHLSASYGGNVSYATSTSAAKTLKVAA
jgi:hypothetical protein